MAYQPLKTKGSSSKKAFLIFVVIIVLIAGASYYVGWKAIYKSGVNKAKAECPAAFSC